MRGAFVDNKSVSLTDVTLALATITGAIAQQIDSARLIRALASAQSAEDLPAGTRAVLKGVLLVLDTE